MGFARHSGGYAVDAKGSLKTGGQNAGRYCMPWKDRDVVDMYFDGRQYALWYGLNGADFGVAYQGDSKAVYRMGVAMFGGQHCLELLSCDVVHYKEDDAQ